ncbi:MAG: heme-dependent oxidative N-demethylase family protein [Candidatus Nanopelagicales bacterium]
MTRSEADQPATVTPRSRLAGITPPIDGRAFRWSVGTRPIPIEQWLTVDDARHAELIRKDELFASRHHEVVATQPTGLAGSRELLAILIAHLQQHHGDTFTVSDSEVVDRASDRVTSLTHGHPIEVAGRMVAEDFCVLDKTDDGWVLTAASVCFTSRWRLRDKLGQNMAGIHGPVPGYEQRLSKAVDAVFDRMTPEQTLARCNWTLLDTDEFYLPIRAVPVSGADIAGAAQSSPGQVADAAADPAAEAALLSDFPWLRVERQTLRKLPVSGSIVFTIHTSVAPVEQLHPNEQARLAQMATSAPAEVRDYKGWGSAG